MSDPNITAVRQRSDDGEQENGGAVAGKAGPRAPYKEKNPYYQPVVPARMRGNRKGERKNQVANAHSAANSRMDRLPDLRDYASAQTPKKKTR